MAKDYVVARAFRGTEQDSDAPQVINTKAGPCHKYLVKFEDNEDKGWIQILRKIENGDSQPVEVGQKLYGSLSENNWGKYDFKREQRPEGQSAPSQAQRQGQTSGNSTVEQKLDYIISLLENGANFPGGPTTAQGPNAQDTPSDGDAPVDLNNLDY